MKRWLVLVAAAFCMTESILALGLLLRNGLRTGNTELDLVTALRTVGQLSLLAVGLGLLTWARRRSPALISKREYLFTNLTVILGAAVCLGLFAIVSTGAPPPPPNAASLPADVRLIRPRSAGTRPAGGGRSTPRRTVSPREPNAAHTGDDSDKKDTEAPSEGSS